MPDEDFAPLARLLPRRRPGAAAGGNSLSAVAAEELGEVLERVAGGHGGNG